jgi:hypothetical protein
MHGLKKEFYDIADHIERTLIKSEMVGSVGNVGCSTGGKREWLFDTVSIVNKLAPETGLNTRQQCKACEAMMTNNSIAKVFLAMTEDCQRDWLATFIDGNDD